uniref:Titin-like n=1 Tax=Saccoglossus kowalevskii TaxID=10224 RepID=A0ABM0MSM3_SACKO|nr:PREDICTED: titin-like [Saccoglossus kowalevskii]
MTLTWSPADDGGSKVTGYIIEKKESTSSRWIKVTKMDERVIDTTYTVLDLIQGSEYQFRIAAENKAGIGKYSEPSNPRIAKPPYDPPGPPGKPVLSDINATKMTLTWTPPMDDGGSKISGYTIEKRERFSTRWDKVNKYVISETTYTVTDLKEGKEYEFHVAAENKAGLGTYSEPSDSVVAKPPYDVPGPPGTPKVSDIVATSMKLTWTEPDDDGGSPVTGYFVEKKEQFSTRWTRVNKTAVSETSFTVEKLTEGDEYEFRVCAENKAGVGQPSKSTGPHTAKPPYAVPDAPGKPKVMEATEKSMTIKWTEPESDGGAKITSYVIEQKDEFSSRWSKVSMEPKMTDTTFTVTKLSEGSEYQFRVAAENKAGVGKYSEPSDPKVAKPPYGLPDAPGKPVVSDIDATKMTLNWTPPLDDGGAPVKGYIIEKKEGFSSLWTKVNRFDVTETTFTVTDLKEKSEYQFRLPDAPGKPVVSDIDATKMTLNWTPPLDDGGASVKGYVIEKKEGFSSLWTKVNRFDVTETTFTVTDLKEKSEYQFQIAAENKAGVGKYSEPSDPKIAKPPYDVPSPPGTPKASDIAATSITLSWTPPDDDGGSPVTGYIVETKEQFSVRWSQVNKTSIADLTYIVKALKEGSTYEFRVCAENKAGVGKPSDSIGPLTPKPKYTVPDAPGKPKVMEVQATSMTIRWMEPESDGGSKITNYVIERKEEFSTRWTKVYSDVKSTDTDFTVTGLTEGSEYQFRVAAENKAGAGKYSEPSDSKVAKPPYGLPDAPGKPVVSDIDATKMTLNWTPPLDDGGAPVKGYIIEKRDKVSSRWMKANRFDVTDLTYVVTDLQQGSEYQFRVAAENKAGVDKYSDPSDPRIAKPPYDVPGPPGKPTVSEIDATSMKLNWSPPDEDGGSPITGYTVEMKEQFGFRWSKVNKISVTDTSYKVEGLKEGNEYEFRVCAENKAGVGKPSDSSGVKKAKPPYDVPDKPGKPKISNVSATSMTLKWTEPDSDGGSKITNYLIEKKEEFATRWSKVFLDEKVTDTEYHVTGLTEGSQYQFHVAAENKAGVSKYSEPSDTVTAKPPYGVPGASDKPSTSDVTATSMTVSWYPPDNDGGSPVTGYFVERKEQFSTMWTRVNTYSVKETSLKVSQLKEGSDYQFRVIAENKAGPGKPSEPSEPRKAKPPYDVPKAPGKPDVNKVDATHMTLLWTTPFSDGGSPITGYIIEKSDASRLRWSKAHRETITDTTYTVTDLMEGTEYLFRVAAENKAGMGPFSEPSDKRLAKPPYDVPGPPGKPKISDVTATSMHLKWSVPDTDGDSKIINYVIERKEKFSSRWIRVTKDNISDTEYQVTHLTEGTEYEFRVAAENKAGVGKFSEPSEARVAKPPYDKPDAPEKPSVSGVTEKSITLTWSPPMDDGGSPIFNYVVEKREKFSTRFIRVSDVTISDTTFTVTGLEKGNEYQFRVSAENKAGVGKPSSPSDPRIAKPPYDVPDSPGAPDITKVEGSSITLLWTPPKDDGGSPVTGYSIERKEKFSSRWVKDSAMPVTDTIYKSTGLTEGTDYEFRIVAENKAGEGKPSFPATLKISVPDAPGRPDVIEVTESSARIKWTVPESDGGARVTGYIVERCDTSKDRWIRVNRTPVKEPFIIAEDLIKGTEYIFRVSAENKAGISEPSKPSKPVVAKPPYDVPDAPSKPDVSHVTRSSMTLEWKPPASDGGNPIISYIVEMKDQFSTKWTLTANVAQPTCTVSDLKENTIYEFRVSAENKAGAGKPSQSSKPTKAKNPYDAPGAPPVPKVLDVTHHSVTLEWTPPESDGGAPILGYVLYSKERLDKLWVQSSQMLECLTHTVSDLRERCVYQFKIAAENKAGVGKPSDATLPITLKPPYAY